MESELVLHIGLTAWPVAVVLLTATSVGSLLLLWHRLRARRIVIEPPKEALVAQTLPVRIAVFVSPIREAISLSPPSKSPLNISKVARRDS